MNETQADILAEMRQHIQAARDYPHDIEITTGDVEDWADRIEAAAELEEIKLRESEAKVLLREYAAAPDESLTPSALELKRELLRLVPGNAAAMREALIAIDDCVWNKHRHTIQETEAHRLATEALYVPPRNCDRFTSGPEAVGAYHRRLPPRFLRNAEEYDDIHDFAAWLYAEKKD